MHGILRETGGGRYDWQPLDESAPIEGLVDAGDAPFNVEIEAEIHDGRVTRWHQVGPARSLTEHVKDIALVWAESTQEEAEAKRATVEGYAREVEHYLKNEAGHAWEIRVTPYVVVSDQPRNLFFRYESVRDQMEAQHPGRYERHTYWCVFGGWKTGIDGEAWIGADKAAVYVTGDERVVRHELKHCFGLGHSTTERQEYGDWTCVMGNGRNGHNAFQAIKLGLIPDRQIADVHESLTTTLVPLEADFTTAGEYRALRVGGGMTKLYLSTRAFRDQSILGTPDRYEAGTVFVHKGLGGRPVYLGPVLPGDSGKFEGVTVRNEGVDGVRTRVTVIIEGQPPQAKPVEPLELPPGDEPLSAFWADERFPLQGFDLTFHGDKLTGYFFSYHPRGKHSIGPLQEHTGKRWLILDGGVVNGRTRFTLYSVADGERKTEGRGVMRIDGGEALIVLESEMYGRESYRIRPFTPAKEDARLGSTGDFEGFSLCELTNPQQPPRTFGYWYGHKPNGLDWRALEHKAGASLDVIDSNTVHRNTRHPKSEHRPNGDPKLVPKLTGLAKEGDGAFTIFGQTKDVTDLVRL